MVFLIDLARKLADPVFEMKGTLQGASSDSTAKKPPEVPGARFGMVIFYRRERWFLLSSRDHDFVDVEAVTVTGGIGAYANLCV